MALRTLLYISLNIVAHTGYSQSPCAEILLNARQKFDDGHLYEIPGTLRPCLEKGFNKSQKIQAYLLLTRTYLFLDDPASAEDSYLHLLKLDPEFELDRDRDPMDVLYLSRKFTTTPIFVLFAKLGGNCSKARPIANYGVDNTQFSKESYLTEYGFQVTGGGELNFSDYVSIGMELGVTQNSYAYENILFDHDLQTFKETQFNLVSATYLKYRYKVNKFSPFAYGGISLYRLISAKADVMLVDRFATDDDGALPEFSVTGPQLDIEMLRRTFNKAFLVGLGLNYRFGYNYFLVDIRGSFGINDLVESSHRYANSDLLYKFGFTDDAKRLNSLSISVGYIKPLYKPRKKSSRQINFINRILGK